MPNITRALIIHNGFPPVLRKVMQCVQCASIHVVLRRCHRHITRILAQCRYFASITLVLRSASCASNTLCASANAQTHLMFFRMCPSAEAGGIKTSTTREQRMNEDAKHEHKCVKGKAGVPNDAQQTATEMLRCGQHYEETDACKLHTDPESAPPPL